MSFDTHSVFAYSTVASVISQNSTTLILAVQTGLGASFATSQQVVIFPAGTGLPTKSNAMICRITGISGDQITMDITSGNREGTSVRTVVPTDQIMNGITPKILTDIEAQINTNTTNIATNTSNITTISGLLPSGAIVGTTDTQTLTNKRVTKRTNTITSSATPTPNADTTDIFTITALAAGATIAAPTGTPTNGQTLIIRIRDNATPQTLAFNAIYRFSTDLAAPVTTVTSKTLYLGFIWNSTDSKWDCIAQLNNF